MRRAAAALLTMLLLAACATIPSSGPVTEVDADDGLGESTARYTPAGPSPGATPDEIVRGFLEAMLAYPVTSQIAAEYLTPAAARAWHPADATIVYTDLRLGLSAPTGSDRAIGVGWRVTARLDEQGRYTPMDDRQEHQWTLTRVAGEWRIADPPDAMVVTEEYFADYFRPFDVFFLDAARSRLVPDPVFRVVGDQLPTGLLASVAEGPEGVRAARVESVVPAAERLRASVPIDADGVADVEFTVPLRTMSTRERELLAAQIVWTLHAVPRVRAVQISGSDGALAVGGEVVQDFAGYAAFAPRPGDGRIAAVVAGRLRRVDADTQRALAGVGEVGAVSGVAASRRFGATIDAAGTTWTLRGGGEPIVLRSDSGFLAPVVDADDVAWAVESSRVRVVVDRAVHEVDVSALGGEPLRSLSVSPDGARYAAVAGDGDGARVLVGPIVREDERAVRLDAPQPVPTPGLAQMRTPRWVSGTRLAMLATGGAGEQVYSVRIDGSDLRPSLPGLPTLLPRIEPVGLAVALGDEPQLYVLADDGSVRALTPRGWERVDATDVSAIG